MLAWHKHCLNQTELKAPWQTAVSLHQTLQCMCTRLHRWLVSTCVHTVHTQILRNFSQYSLTVLKPPSGTHMWASVDRNSHSAESKSSAVEETKWGRETSEQTKVFLTCEKKVTTSHRTEEWKQEKIKEKEEKHVSNGQVHKCKTFNFIKEAYTKCIFLIWNIH